MSERNLSRFNEARNLLKEIQVSADHANHLLAKGELSLARTYINGIHKRDQKLQDEIHRLNSDTTPSVGEVQHPPQGESR